jgi:preprotein translocase subunit SecG
MVIVPVLYVIIGVVFTLGCIALITSILLQKKRTSGLGSVAGMGSSTGGTYWEKNKSRSREGQLEKWTKIGGAAFMVLAVILCLI